MIGVRWDWVGRRESGSRDQSCGSGELVLACAE